jgi:hypothetical protein
MQVGNSTSKTTQTALLEWTKASSQLVTAATEDFCEQCCSQIAAVARKTMERRPGTRVNNKSSDCYYSPTRPTTIARTITVYRALRPRESLYDGLSPCNPSSKQSLHHHILQGSMSSPATTATIDSSSNQHRRTGRFLSVSLQPETAVYFAMKRAMEEENGLQLPARVAKITLHLNEDEYRNLHGKNDDDFDTDSSASTISASCDSASAENIQSEPSHQYHYDGRQSTTTATTLFHVPSVARQEKWTGLVALEQARALDEICLTRPIPASDMDKVILLTQEDVDYFLSVMLLHRSRGCRSLVDSFQKFCQAYRKWPGRVALSHNTKFDGQRLRIVEVTTMLVVQRRQHMRHVQQILQDGGLVAIGLSHVYHDDIDDDDDENDNENVAHHHGHAVVVVYGQSRNSMEDNADALPIGFMCPQHARILAPHHLANVRYRRYELPFQQQQQQQLSSSSLLLPSTSTTKKKLTLLLQMSLREAKHVVDRIEKTKIGSASIHFPDGPSFLSPGSL